MEQKPKKKKKPRGKARTIEGRCIACGARCQMACPVDAIEMNEKEEPVILEDECIGCTKCIQACPVDAILGAAKQMHTVIADECTGCDLCVEPCPVDCIDMIVIEPDIHSWTWAPPLVKGAVQGEAPGDRLIATDSQAETREESLL